MSLQGPFEIASQARIARRAGLKNRGEPPNELLALVYVRTPAAKNDHFRRSYCQHGINDCVAYAQQRESFALAGAARELGSLRPPPDGCRFEERILDLERSLREERRALRRADTFYGRIAFRRF